MGSDLSFSIAVPIGSYHPFLPACLASLVTQQVPLEIAILDASGDPRVRDLVDQHSGAISFRHHGPDDGQTDAIVKGWEATNGSVLGWLNADDVLAPDALKRATETFQTQPDVDVVYGHSLICDGEGFIVGYHWNVMSPGDQILNTCCISQPSCFFKRVALDAVGGLDKSLHYTMDWDLWIRLYKSGAKFHLNEKIRSLVLWSEEAKTGGFGQQRRWELKRLIDQNASQKVRWNAYLGFASQYLYEYILPRSVRDWVWRRNVSGGEGMFGLSVAGDIEDLASFEMFHYDDPEKSGLELKTNAALNEFELRCNGVPVPLACQKPGKYEYRMGTPISAGEMVKFDLHCLSDSPVHMGGMRFLK